MEKYDDVAYMLRKKLNYSTKIKIGKTDFLLCAKPKNSTVPWSKIPPLIKPEEIPLFDVGSLTNEMINILKMEAKERRKKKVEMNENIITKL